MSKGTNRRFAAGEPSGALALRRCQAAAISAFIPKMRPHPKSNRSQGADCLGLFGRFQNDEAVADGRVLPGRRLTASMKFRCALKNQERESSESPMLKAFWRVAPSVLLSFFAIWDALVFLRAIVFSSRSSPEVHARRFFFLFAITPPFQERQLVSLMRAKEKPLAPESNVKNATSIPGS
jgi:hypothetical protein